MSLHAEQINIFWDLLHVLMSQKLKVLITTSARTSNPTENRLKSFCQVTRGVERSNGCPDGESRIFLVEALSLREGTSHAKTFWKESR